MEIIHLLVSMSLSGISLFLDTSAGLVDTLWTIATRHCVSTLSSFIERSCARTPGDTHLRWVGFSQLTRVWPTSLSFYSSLCSGPGKKCLIELCPTVAVKHNSSTPPPAPFPLFSAQANKTSLRAHSLLFWDAAGLLSWVVEECLSQSLSLDYGFSSTTVTMGIKPSWDTQTQLATERCEKWKEMRTHPCLSH